MTPIGKPYGNRGTTHDTRTNERRSNIRHPIRRTVLTVWRSCTMIQIFNSAINHNERTELPLSAVKIQEQNICELTARPYIMFEHSSYPLGALKAEYNGKVWICDLC